jgi:glycosyltransferase involved in cell wall biosynthesis
MNSLSHPKIIAIIPAHNEADHIEKVVSEAKLFLPVLVVDDGSSDATATIASLAGATVISQSPNQGKGTALITGFRYALANNFEAAVMLDGDGQHDPSEISTFLQEYFLRHADLIIGERDFSKMPLIRRTSNTIGRKLLSWALGQSVPDNQSGYRLLSRRFIEETMTSTEKGFELEVDMVIRCIRKGFLIDWVPIKTIYAGEKSHISPLNLVMNYFRLVWQARKR